MLVVVWQDESGGEARPSSGIGYLQTLLKRITTCSGHLLRARQNALTGLDKSRSEWERHEVEGLNRGLRHAQCVNDQLAENPTRAVCTISTRSCVLTSLQIDQAGYKRNQASQASIMLRHVSAFPKNCRFPAIVDRDQAPIPTISGKH